MPEGKPQQTLGDYVTIALSPALIMTLVGSLVFFLLEILYVGQYTGRLQWTLFFFIFGIVLIARISIEQSGGRAALFGLALGGAVFVALQSFVKYPEGSPTASFGWAINLGLMALSWWCAHRLTWDCTYIDDSVDASGKGVLEAAGMEQCRLRRRARRRRMTRPAGIPPLVYSAGGTATLATAKSSCASRTRRGCGSSTSRWQRCPYSGWAKR